MKIDLLTGKNILITGASSGIGRCIACRCASAGANIILVGQDQARLENCTLEFPKEAQFHIIRTNLRDTSLLENLVADAVKKMGTIHGFVHSAGVFSPVPLRMTSPEDFISDYTINVVAGFELARIISMKKNLAEGGASFVFISSISGHVGITGTSSYASTKGALLSGARAMAAELMSKKIRVNTVSPSYILDTGITKNTFSGLSLEAQKKIMESYPLGMGTVDDVAWPVLFLLSEKARWITGSDFCIDGGYRLRQ